ncbi:MAG TPA: hypothetical protein VHO48_13285, partial [Anaerolineaceae bacterium]|nr:hypothetical protein [Anaerolineaceae bacterium]
MKPTRHALYLLFSISLVLTVYLYRNAILVNPQGVYTLHQELVAGQADSPNRYRVLVPHVVEAIRMAVKADAVTA